MSGAGVDDRNKSDLLSQSSGLQYIKGIGPKRARALLEEGIVSVRDLLYFTPRRYLDRRTVSPIRKIRLLLGSEEGLDDEVTAIVTVRRLSVPVGRSGRKRLVMKVADASGEANLVFFQGVRFFAQAFQPGDVVAISGPPELYGGTVQWTHPELERMEEGEEDLVHSGRIIPVYRETQGMKSAGLTSRTLRRIFESLFTADYAEEMVDYLPAYIRELRDLPDLKSAIQSLHFPESEEALDRARYRMKYEELFFFQLGLGLRKGARERELAGRELVVRSELAASLRESLPFELTGAQKRVLVEIMHDLASGKSMNRLLQGDVGSGKTIVALLSLLVAVDNGLQGAMMAPTEILAEQHYQTVRGLLEHLPVRIELIVGGLKKKARNEILEAARAGEVDILIGTHAIFQKDVEFSALGLVIIDEQHRFGVKQRGELMTKGEAPHTLIMSATPIPRTLTMTLYGDLDVSLLDELPRDRKPVKTAIRFEHQVESVWEFIRSEVHAGRQAYIVYPLVEKSETLELKSAVEHYEYHRDQTFPGLRVGLLHGQLFWYEKEEMMRDFLEKKLDILVATTVIEVGIDVPNASVMVIENAERFGLSQLHQLRGRVGRGADQSYCILVTKDHFRYQMRRGLSQNEQRQERKGAIRRLTAMTETTDGFRISEIDLEIRGPGEMGGTRQSGLPDFRHANVVSDVEIIRDARDDAFGLLEGDPLLKQTDNLPLRTGLKESGRHLSFVEIG